MRARLSLAARACSRPPSPLLAATIALAVYLFSAWFVFEAGAPWSPDEGAKLLQMLSLRIEGGALRCDIAYPGRALDPLLEFALAENPRQLFSVIDGRLELQRLPLFPLLSLPFYRWLGLHGLYLLPALAGAAIGPLALGLVERGERRGLAWALIAFGSPVFIYSSLFWEHTLAAALGLAGARVVFRACFDGEPAAGESAPASRQTPAGQALAAVRSRRLAEALLAAGLMAAAAYLRLETLLLAGAGLAAAWLLCRRRRAWLLLCAALLGLALAPYLPLHASLFGGSGLPANARYLYRPLAYLKSAGWGALPELLVGPGGEESLEPGWMGWLWSGAAVAAIAASLFPGANVAIRNIRRLALGISAAAAACFLFNPAPYRAAHGLLLAAPWALLGACAAPSAWRRGGLRLRAVALAAALGLLGYALAMLGLRGSSPHGGLEWGARFALPLYPLLALLAAHAPPARAGQPPSPQQGRPAPRGARLDAALLIALACLGVGFQARGVLTIRGDKQVNAALNQALLDIPERHILTDLWWLLPNAAPLQPRKALYSAAQPWELAAWVERAASQGVRQFGLVSLDHGLPAALKASLPGYQLTILELKTAGNVLIFRMALQPP
ncbi:MAG: hypothetical protein JXA78_02730 [Anaerolineales bacterium]|nr:hypothetical protein [Anaerolineales bacterium]